MNVVLINKNNIKWFGSMYKNNLSGYEVIQSQCIAFGAVLDGVACGIIVFGVEGINAELTWLYVAPEYRDKKVATNLLTESIKKIRGLGIGNVIALYPNDSDLGLYLDRLFVHSDFRLDAIESKNYSVSIKDMVKSPNFAKYFKSEFKSTFSFYTLEDLSVYDVKKLDISKLYDIDAHKDLSAVAIKDDKLVGQLLIRKITDEKYDVSILKNTSSNPLVVLGLFCKVARLIKKRADQKTLLAKAVISFQFQGGKVLNVLKDLTSKSDVKSSWIHVAKLNSLL